jgi:ABC-type polysaccharide/polyol phosphate export permease
MAGPRHGYQRAALLGLAWVAGAALLTFGAAWLVLRLGYGDGSRLPPAFLWAAVVGFVVLPFLAAGVHRSVRLVTTTAFFEAALLAVLWAVGFLVGNG